MNWRTNTLAEKPGHRHEATEPPKAWRPSDGYREPVQGSWAVFWGVLIAAAVVVGFVWSKL